MEYISKRIIPNAQVILPNPNEAKKKPYLPEISKQNKFDISPKIQMVDTKQSGNYLKKTIGTNCDNEHKKICKSPDYPTGKLSKN